MSKKKKNIFLQSFNQQFTPSRNLFDSLVKKQQLEVWKAQMLPIVREQYKDDPKLHEHLDLEKNTNYFMSNPMVQTQMSFSNITREEITALLKDIIDIVRKENAIVVDNFPTEQERLDYKEQYKFMED